MGVTITYQSSIRDKDGKLNEHLEGVCHQSDIGSLPTDWPDGSALLVIETKETIIFDALTGTWS